MNKGLSLGVGLVAVAVLLGLLRRAYRHGFVDGRDHGAQSLAWFYNLGTKTIPASPTEGRKPVEPSVSGSGRRCGGDGA